MTMDEIEGVLERITYENTENGYRVGHIQEKGKRTTTCVVGTFPQAYPGETLTLQGEWKRHATHGVQFAVTHCKQRSPSDLVGIKKYLSSGLVKGIGPIFAKKIVDHFGIQTLDVIDDNPGRLREIPGVGPKKIEAIATCWQEQRAIRSIMIFLQSHKISPALAQKIFKRYGSTSIETLEDDPYRLAKEIHGVGFATADQVASSLGIEKHSPKRVSAGISFSLQQLALQGHTCYPKIPFVVEAANLLDVPEEEVEKELETLLFAEDIIQHQIGDVHFVSLPTYYFAEVQIGKRLKSLKNHPSPLRRVQQDKAIVWVQEKLEIQLAEEQVEAVQKALEEKVLIITGGPGTGKSTILKAILAITQKLTPLILLMAPTGKAAKRMHEITGQPAYTIHSRLEMDFRTGQFRKNQETPLDYDLVVVDEASMIDTHLMQNLLNAIDDRTRLIFVGDIHQLPSVGPGQVLKDLITSSHIPTVRLTKIFRQAEESSIVTNAHLINQGQVPDTSARSNSDFFFIHKKEAEECLQTIIDLVLYRLPKRFNLDPIEEIQVLSPMRKGVVGIDSLNMHLQKALVKNKGTPLHRSGKEFYVGDKVMQIRNNYKKEIFNGDVGRIVSIDAKEQNVHIDYDGTIVEYAFFELEEITLAYATSIHKYQGSEAPCVILPVHTSHFKMLQRNLLYTGVTRGKKLVILVGTTKALFLAVKNEEVLTRHTALTRSLAIALNPLPFFGQDVPARPANALHATT